MKYPVQYSNVFRMALDRWLEPSELQTFRSFNRSWIAVMSRLDTALADAGLNRTYFDILARLERAPGHAMRMSELAEKTDSKASRLTYAVGRLEADGLVRREIATDDRRGWMARLTDKGRRELDRLSPIYAAAVREHFLTYLEPQMHEQIVGIGSVLLEHLAPERIPHDPHQDVIAS